MNNNFLLNSKIFAVKVFRETPTSVPFEGRNFHPGRHSLVKFFLPFSLLPSFRLFLSVSIAGLIDPKISSLSVVLTLINFEFSCKDFDVSAGFELTYELSESTNSVYSRLLYLLTDPVSVQNAVKEKNSDVKCQQTNVSRPCHVGNPSSNSNTEVKQH